MSRWDGRVVLTKDVVDRMEKLGVDTNAVQIFHSHETARTNSLQLRLLIDRRLVELTSNTNWQALQSAVNSRTNDLAVAALTNDDKSFADTIKALLEARKGCDEVIAQRLPFRVAGFAHEPEIYLQLVNFICILALLMAYGPTRPGNCRGDICFRRLFWPALLVGLLYWILGNVVPLGLRYESGFTKTFETGRRAFAFYSYDLNRSEWLAANVQEYVLAVMLGILGLAWYQSRQVWDKHLESYHAKGNRLEDVLKLNAEVSHLFHEWQRNSLILAGAFLPWSYFAWSFTPMPEGSETRYIFIALIDHMTWIVIWVLISRPLLDGLHVWRKLKLEALLVLTTSPDQKNRPIAERFKLIAELEPISHLQLIAISIAAAVSFFLPLLGILK